jgi:hypothetical protein
MPDRRLERQKPATQRNRISKGSLMTDSAEREAYPEQDHMALGEYHLRHIDRMTAEGLHRKSDIAAQLAWRDREIDRLRASTPIPAGEPVAWQGVHEPWDFWQSKPEGIAVRPLFATPPAPPAHKVVPLSEERIEDAWRKVRRSYSWEEDGLTFVHAIARSIEAAHGICIGEAALSAAPSDPKDDVHQT